MSLNADYLDLRLNRYILIKLEETCRGSNIPKVSRSVHPGHLFLSRNWTYVQGLDYKIGNWVVKHLDNEPCDLKKIERSLFISVAQIRLTLYYTRMFALFNCRIARAVSCLVLTSSVSFELRFGNIARSYYVIPLSISSPSLGSCDVEKLIKICHVGRISVTPLMLVLRGGLRRKWHNNYIPGAVTARRRFRNRAASGVRIDF